MHPQVWKLDWRLNELANTPSPTQGVEHPFLFGQVAFLFFQF